MHTHAHRQNYFWNNSNVANITFCKKLHLMLEA